MAAEEKAGSERQQEEPTQVQEDDPVTKNQMTL
jgi:hypothetical protein